MRCPIFNPSEFKNLYAGGLNRRKLNQSKGNKPIQSRPTNDSNDQSIGGQRLTSFGYVVHQKRGKSA